MSLNPLRCFNEQFLLLRQAEAVRSLLAHRLPGDECSTAKAEWNDIVEGEHALWQNIGEPYKHTIRAFLVYFHTQILRQATERFNFSNGSVGSSYTLAQGGAWKLLYNASKHLTLKPQFGFVRPHSIWDQVGF